MAKTIGRFTPAEVPDKPASFGDWIVKQTGFNARLGLIPASISPTTINAIRTEAEGGDLGRLFELYEKMFSTDARIGGIIGSLRATVSGLPLKTSRSKTVSAGENALAEDYRAVVEEALLQMDTHSFVSDAADAYLIGTRAFQMRWTFEDYPRGKKLALIELVEPIPGQSLKMEMQQDHKKWGELKVIEQHKPEGTFFSDIDKRQAFVITDGHAKGRHDTIGAARRILGWWITKMYAQLWWVEYVESYGQPIRLGFYSPEAKNRERAELKNFLQNIGRSKWGLFPQGADLKLMEATDSGNVTTFSDLIDMANNEIAIALIGQTGMTQDSAQGSRAKLQVQNTVRVEILMHIAQIVRKGFDGLTDAILRCNYGETYVKRLRPKTMPIVKKAGSDKEKMDVFTVLTEAGVPVGVDEIHDQIGIPQPKEGEQVVFRGKVVVMTTIEQMNKEADERQNSNAGQGNIPEGQNANRSGENGPDDGAANKGSDA